MTSFHFRHTATDRRGNASWPKPLFNAGSAPLGLRCTFFQVQRVNNMASQDEKASIEGVPRSTGRHGAVDLVATQEFSVFPASHVTRELYCSSNGGRWYLCRDADRVSVVHVPNVASGGKVENFAIGEFLAGGKSGPEHQELLRLIGTLVDVP